MPTTYDQVAPARARLLFVTQFDRPLSDMISSGGTSGGITTARERIAEGIIRALLVFSAAEGWHPCVAFGGGQIHLQKALDYLDRINLPPNIT